MIILKNKKIYLVWIFVALYLFSELVLPVNCTFSRNLYNTDIDYAYNESYQDDQTEHIDTSTDEENDIEEVDDDSCLYSSQITEKTYCVLQTNKLNLENILDASSQLCKIVLFAVCLIQTNLDSICTTVRNCIEILRTVILLN